MHATKPIENILPRLNRVRQRGDGWDAECSGHEDNKNSLCITEKSDGTVLVKCQAGCDTKNVLGEIGLKMKDLFPSSGNRNGLGRIVAVYDYVDESGLLLYQSVRFEPKDFRQRTPNPSGGFEWKLNGVRRVLYRLPELLAADDSRLVLIPEGEQDVDRLIDAGFVATCNVGGACKWRDEYSEHLRGRKVAILADNDGAGRRHVQLAARSLSGIASSNKVIEFDGLPENGDVSDWLNAGHTPDELKAIVRLAPEWEPLKESSAQTATFADLKIETTDRGNGRLLAKIGKGKILFCQEFDDWMFYDDTRWFQDNIAAERIAKTVPDELWEAGRQLDNDGVVKWAQSSCASARITAMLKMARSEQGMSIKASDLNPDPWKLNCPNGTIQLNTTELRPHRPEDFITTLCPTPFVPDAKCPRFMLFMDEVFKDPDVIAFLQRLFGYILTGVIREHILVIFFGDGRNGKGTLVETIVDVLGNDYIQAVNADMLTTSGPARDRDYHVAELHGKRLAFCSETSEGRKLREEWIKRATGNDTLTGRHPYGRPFNFTPSHKWLLQTNALPLIEGVNEGIWSRIRLVEFNQQFLGKADDTDLRDKLMQEREGILAWMVTGCEAWQQNGLNAPPAVMAATKRYRAEEDVVALFVAERCITGHLNEVSSTAMELYAVYRDWAQKSGEIPRSKTWFGTRMGKLFQRDENTRPKRYLGVRPAQFA